MLKNIDWGYSLEPHRRGGSNKYPNLCFEQKCEKYQKFLSENFQFLEVKFSIYLNRRVFVMISSHLKEYPQGKAIPVSAPQDMICKSNNKD